MRLLLLKSWMHNRPAQSHSWPVKKLYSDFKLTEERALIGLVESTWKGHGTIPHCYPLFFYRTIVHYLSSNS